MRGWLAAAWPTLKWVLLLLIVVVVALWVVFKKKNPVAWNEPEDMIDADLMLQNALDEAESMKLEAQVRKKIANEQAEKRLEDLQVAKAEPDPAKRKQQLASMLSSWGS